MAFALTPEREKQVEELLTHYPTKRAACLPVLWLCQRQHGWVSAEVIDYVAERLSLSTAVVKGVVTFYTMFFEHEVAPNVIWVCRTLSCDLRGGKAIQEHLEDRLGCRAGEKSRDGKFTLLKAECLAGCGQAPMVQINDDYHEDLTIEKLDAIIDELEAKTAAPDASRSHESPPAGGQ
jgi:NADH-quinone oxidoreductase subunit E